MTDKEVWKSIEGFEGFFQISNHGRIRSLDRYVNARNGGKRFEHGRIMKSSINSRKYYILPLRKNGYVKTFRINRLVAIAFIPNPENKPEVNHIDGDKQNNHVKNLEWSTHKENIKHALETGLQVPFKGCEVGTSKLKNHEVLKIRQLYKTGNYTYKQLSEMFNVSYNTIYSVIKRTSWKHI